MGFVVGVGAMIIQIMIFVAAFAIGNAGGNASGKPTPGQEAVAAFAILKLFGYVSAGNRCCPPFPFFYTVLGTDDAVFLPAFISAPS